MSSHAAEARPVAFPPQTRMRPIILLYLFLQSAFASAEFSGTVVAVTSGDCLQVETARYGEVEVCLTGVLAPEEPASLAEASRARLHDMVLGREVEVQYAGANSNGSISGKVWVQAADCRRCGKNLNANHAQILYGAARWRRSDRPWQTPEEQGRYESAEQEARLRKRGLWAGHNATTELKSEAKSPPA